ncbi:hypothetical protein LCGC14_0294590 [marine sediment metagenome]|uniref:Uncharacterized protein n=1 Tax=marine sediment metagenome TaxID=412755 RepID=A0A0F9WDB0_9ZZZZ
MPWPTKNPRQRGGWTHTNNRPLDIIHNHNGPPIVRYGGFCQTAPTYHLFRCHGHSDPPRRVIQVVVFDRLAFVAKSKAGHGGCSMRECPGEAEFMNREEKKAYCERCAKQRQGVVACTWTSIYPCHNQSGLNQPPFNKPCSLCTAYEGGIQ